MGRSGRFGGPTTRGPYPGQLTVIECLVNYRIRQCGRDAHTGNMAYRLEPVSGKPPFPQSKHPKHPKHPLNLQVRETFQVFQVFRNKGISIGKSPEVIDLVD